MHSNELRINYYFSICVEWKNEDEGEKVGNCAAVD